MPRKLIEVVEHEGMIDEIYQEEDGTYFHDIRYKDDETSSEESVEK